MNKPVLLKNVRFDYLYNFPKLQVVSEVSVINITLQNFV